MTDLATITNHQLAGVLDKRERRLAAASDAILKHTKNRDAEKFHEIIARLGEKHPAVRRYRARVADAIEAESETRARVGSAPRREMLLAHLMKSPRYRRQKIYGNDP